MAHRLSMAELLKLKKRMGGKSAATASASSAAPPAGAALAALDVVQGATLYEKIDKLAFQNGMCLPPDRSGSRTAGPRRIAICLVIVDKLIHEDIWRRWVESSDEEYSAELFVHAKHPAAITSAWARARVLPGSFRPEWNSVEVVRAMLAVLQAAVRDPAHYDRFLFGTGIIYACACMCDNVQLYCIM